MTEVFFARLRAFAQNRRGNVTIIVGFAIVPLFGIIALSIDYSMALTAKAKLDQAADAAAMAGVVAAQNYVASYTGAGNPVPAALIVAQTQAQAQFNANAGATPGGGVLSITNMSFTNSGQVLTGTVSYSLANPTTFAGVLGFKNLTVTGTSTSSMTMQIYTNVNVVIDISQSMGIGATAADQQIIYNATGSTPSGSCVLACHYEGTTTTARSAGATLRIDVAKQAIVAALTQLQSTYGKYQVAIYTLSNALSNVYLLSSNIPGAIAAVNAIDLANTANSGGTNTTYALSQLNSQLPTPGAGLTQATAQGVVMFITDAIQDSDEKYTWSLPFWDEVDSNFVLYGSTYQNTFSGRYGPVTPTVQGFDPTQCSPLKTKGYTMMTLDINYVIPAANLQSKPIYSGYFNFIQNSLLPMIPTNMASCATSSATAFSADTPAEITAAVTQMFAIAAATQARLTH